MASQRYLLCRPHGGLNDTLCQMERCAAYAEQHGRKLLIDSTRSGLLLSFSNFFRPLADDQIISLDDKRLIGLNFDSLDCQPAVIGRRLNAYRVKHVGGRLREAKTLQELSFDFSRDYDEPLLVHEQHGGGSSSHDFLRRVTFADPVASEIRDALSKLGRCDAAIHLRNTDQKTFVGAFLRKIRNRLEGQRVLICTDNANTIERVRTFMKSSQVVTASNITGRGKRLHDGRNYADHEEKRQATVNAFVDLCALASADALYLAQLSRGNYSGFSELAVFLTQNRDVLGALLRLPPTGDRPSAGTVVRVKSPALIALVLRSLRRWQAIRSRRNRK